MRYVISGPIIIDELEIGAATRVVPGGALYALTGSRVWDTDCALVTNVGGDFHDLCGSWLRDNGLTDEYVRIALARTKRTRLRYVENGLFREEPVYELGLHDRIQRQDRRTADHVLRAVDGTTRGVYIEADDEDSIWADARIHALARRLPVMWEVQTHSALEPGRRRRTLDVARTTGLYSVNLPEACALFGVDGEEAAVDAVLGFGVPCLLRVGSHGSYLLVDGETYHEPSVTLGDTVDPTGCGNASTAGALTALGEGAPPADVPRMANISAAVVLGQYSVPPRIDDVGGEAARSMLDDLRRPVR